MDYQAQDGTQLTYDQVLERYFAPGAIRPVFGGQDRILAFDAESHTVTAEAVDATGQTLPGLEGRPRTHMTLPAPGSSELNAFLREQRLEPTSPAELRQFRRHQGVLALEHGVPEQAERKAQDSASAAKAKLEQGKPPAGSDYAKEVAAVFIDQLKRGTAPWTKPWAPGQVSSQPMNPITGKPYRGSNALWLMTQGAMRGYTDPRWMTFRQAQEEGAGVRKGERGTKIQYWMWSDQRPVLDDVTGQPKKDEKGEVVTERVELERPRVFTATVFNADQIDGLPPLEKQAGPTEWERHTRAEAILQASGAAIVHQPGDRAFYSPLSDKIVLPDRVQFKSADGYYGTALHELAHWTGAEDRLNRDLTGTFGNESYAREELRAEIASFMVGTRVGVGHDPSNHASYVAHWIKALEQDPREIFRAAGDAEKIADFVQQFDRTIEKPVEKQSPSTTVVVETAPAKETAMAAEQRTNLVVPYAERQEAKAAGARWDKAQKVWFAPKGADLAPLARWMGTEKAQPEAAKPPAGKAAEASATKPVPAGDRTYLAVPFAEKNTARELGAKWDKGAKAWFVPPGVALDPFSKWMPKPRTTTTIADPVAEFEQAVRKAGLRLPEGERPIMDGKWHRVRVEGDKAGEKSGAYRGYTDGRPAGFIENHKAGTREAWKSQAPAPVLTPDEKAVLAAETAQRRAERDASREKGYETAAAACQKRWEQATPVSSPDAHPYLKNKDVPSFGVRVDKAGRLLVPLYDTTSNKLVSLQAIGPDGRKSFEKGGRVSGASFRLDPCANRSSNKTLLVAEGFATAATVARATGHSTYVAFNAANLGHVAVALRKQHPDALICIAGDNDHRAQAEGRINVGRTKAEAAALAADAFPLLPQFDKDAKGSDWNDLEKAKGRDAVRTALENGLTAAHLVHQVRAATQVEAAQPTPDKTKAPVAESLPPDLDFRKYGSWDGR